MSFLSSLYFYVKRKIAVCLRQFYAAHVAKRFQSKRNLFALDSRARKSVHSVGIEHDKAVGAGVLRKSNETVLDMFQIFEIIGMVQLHIEQHGDVRMQISETFSVLARLADAEFSAALFKIAARALQHAADKDCGLFLKSVKHVRQHARSGGFAVTSAYRNAEGIIVENVPQSLLAGHERNGIFPAKSQLHIVLLYRRSVYTKFDGGFVYIACVMSYANLGAQPAQQQRLLVFPDVAAAYRIALRQKILRQCAHADTAYTYQMNLFSQLKFFHIKFYYKM